MILRNVMTHFSQIRKLKTTKSHKKLKFNHHLKEFLKKLTFIEHVQSLRYEEKKVQSRN